MNAVLVNAKGTKDKWKEEGLKSRLQDEEDAHEAENDAKDAKERDDMGLGPESVTSIRACSPNLVHIAWLHFRNLEH